MFLLPSSSTSTMISKRVELPRIRFSARTAAYSANYQLQCSVQERVGQTFTTLRKRGTTDLDFVGSGESFSLFAGLVDTLHLSRTLDHDRSDLVRGRRRNRLSAAFVIQIENSGEEATRLRVADRIPVSDDRDIHVTQVRIEPAVEPNQKGLFLWEIDIPPKSTRDLEVSYTVSYPSDLAAQAGTSKAAPSAVNQIKELEARF